MKKIINFLMRLGVVEGMTFRCEVEDGVGPFLTPNPSPNRMNPRAIPLPVSVPELTRQGTGRRFFLVGPLGNRESRRKASGRWTAKPLHINWS